MAEALDKETTPAEDVRWVESKEIPGLLHSTSGVFPIKDWDAFMQSLPDLGDDGDRFLDAIMENRAMRRALAAERADKEEC